MDGVTPLLTVQIRREQDVVFARQRARQLAELVGFDGQDQVRIATALSEVARNAFQYAGGGRATFSLADRGRALRIDVQDSGGGIRDLEAVLGGTYTSRTGMGLGLVGARRLMDALGVRSSPQGTLVHLEKRLPAHAPSLDERDVRRISAALAQSAPPRPEEELRVQNRELMQALADLGGKQEELVQLNRELEDTNRGVVALYAELDEKAESLRKASEAKTSFLSSMTHEFRTPLNALLNISGMLLEGFEGELNPEQRKLVSLIQRSAQDLSELVNDLLDLAKVEAGKIAVRASEFEINDLFGALRGLLRPLADRNPQVALRFVVEEGVPRLCTDEGKVAQVLRNLISNALKYTEAGEVEIRAERAGGGWVRFSVRDTGIGIPPELHERIFEEFFQVDSRLQGKVRGTGLGLSLTRRLAGLLGGSIALRSAPGQGSTFTVALPAVYGGPADGQYVSGAAPPPAAPAPRAAAPAGEVLVIDDDPAARLVLTAVLADLGAPVCEAADGEEGLRLARRGGVSAIFLDLTMPGLDGFAVLGRLMAEPELRAIPVFIHTSRDLEAEEAAYLGEVSAGLLRKDARPRAELARDVRALLESAGALPADRASSESIP